MILNSSMPPWEPTRLEGGKSDAGRRLHCLGWSRLRCRNRARGDDWRGWGRGKECIVRCVRINVYMLIVARKRTGGAGEGGFSFENAV